jgi:long-subunit acyl-CoA synthetase (AMP-forming)
MQTLTEPLTSHFPRMQTLGVQRGIISGGSSLSPHLDDFYEALGVPVLNGWGLTEASPVLACRRFDAPREPARNVRGSTGFVVPGTQIRCAAHCATAWHVISIDVCCVRCICRGQGHC